MKVCVQAIMVLLCTLVCSSNLINAQTIRYGFTQDVDNPLLITAVAVPDFSSDNVTVSSAVFSFSVSNPTMLLPFVEAVPASGSFYNIHGVWVVQRLTPEAYSGVGFNEGRLLGNDVYQVVLQNSPELTAVEAGEAIPLFSFELIDDCQDGMIEVLMNDGLLRNSVLQDLQANFNNQISVSVDDARATDIYDESDPFIAQLQCPLLLVSTEELEVINPAIKVQPNPAVEWTEVVITSDVTGSGTLALFDIQNRELLQQDISLIKGQNKIRLDIAGLVSGKYQVVATVDELHLRTTIVKID